MCQLDNIRHVRTFFSSFSSLQQIKDIQQTTMEIIDARRQSFQIKISCMPSRIFLYIHELDKKSENKGILDDTIVLGAVYKKKNKKVIFERFCINIKKTRNETQRSVK